MRPSKNLIQAIAIVCAKTQSKTILCNKRLLSVIITLIMHNGKGLEKKQSYILGQDHLLSKTTNVNFLKLLFNNMCTTMLRNVRESRIKGRCWFHNELEIFLPVLMVMIGSLWIHLTCWLLTSKEAKISQLLWGN